MEPILPAAALLASIADPDFRLLCEQVLAAMERYQIPGVAVGLLHEGVEQMAGFGVTSIENPLPVTPDTIFQIGSITKTVTATLVLSLVEAGTLDLDVPVRTYLPDLRLQDEEVAARVTLRHLLTHAGGWMGDYFEDTGEGDDAVARYVVGMADLPQLTPLGTIWHYNNAGIVLAGRVIEAVTGRPYETVAREQVLVPLGMDRSFFFAAEVLIHRFAVGHNQPVVDGVRVRQIARPWPLPRSAAPAGGIASTARDQLRYARFHLGSGTTPGGHRILQPGSLLEMQTPQIAAANDEQLGLTWFLRDVEGTRIVSHRGSTNGQMAAFQLVPARQFALTLLTNGDLGHSLDQGVVRWALAHYLGLHESDPEPGSGDEAALAAYPGRYTHPNGDWEVSLREGALWMQEVPKKALPGAELLPPDPPMRLAPHAPDRFVVTSEPYQGTRVEVLRDPDGSVRWLRTGLRVFARES